MKTIIAGSRTMTDKDAVARAIYNSGLPITEVVSGGCRGADLIGEEWAIQHGLPVQRFNALWTLQGKAAGPIRNEHMAKYADALVAVWDGKSRGTKNMIDLARQYGLKVFVETI